MHQSASTSATPCVNAIILSFRCAKRTLLFGTPRPTMVGKEQHSNALKAPRIGTNETLVIDNATGVVTSPFGVLFYAPGAAKKKDGESVSFDPASEWVYSSGDTMYSMEPLAQLGDASPAPIYVTGAQGDGLKEWVRTQIRLTSRQRHSGSQSGNVSELQVYTFRADGSSGLKLDAWEVSACSWTHHRKSQTGS